MKQIHVHMLHHVHHIQMLRDVDILSFRVHSLQRYECRSSSFSSVCCVLSCCRVVVCCRVVGLCVIRLSVHWFTGLLVYWFVGLLVYCLFVCVCVCLLCVGCCVLVVVCLLLVGWLLLVSSMSFTHVLHWEGTMWRAF